MRWYKSEAPSGFPLALPTPAAFTQWQIMVEQTPQPPSSLRHILYSLLEAPCGNEPYTHSSSLLMNFQYPVLASFLCLAPLHHPASLDSSPNKPLHSTLCLRICFWGNQSRKKVKVTTPELAGKSLCHNKWDNQVLHTS